VLKEARKMQDLTVIVPAYNEAAYVGSTIESLQNQTVRPSKIIVVDDYSTDQTGKVARSYEGVTVVRPKANTGSKAGAQNFALQYVDTGFTMVLDADTSLAKDAIEKLWPAFNDSGVAAACGFVLPRRVKTIWERGRYIEYLFSFSFYKQIQDYFGKPLISSGCLSMYRTKYLRKAGGWSTRTMAEDMDLTWTLYRLGYKVRFIPGAICYPIEPDSLKLMHRQLKRWSAAFLQNLRLHRKHIVRIPFLFSAIAVSLSDAILSSVIYLIVLPLLAIFVSQWLLLGYIIDAPVIMIPALLVASKRREIWLALTSFPALFVLRIFNGFIFLKAVWFEVILRRRLMTYEKGH
jgi:cellulose synthase/poly-beta-1,6-N-acetylglucosamine synthase-like glycosyltransferase